MNKYFKNEKNITPQSLLQEFNHHRWGTYPGYIYETKRFQKLVDQCSQTQEYQKWHKKYRQIAKQYDEVASDRLQVQTNKSEIILKNSQEQFLKVFTDLKQRESILSGTLHTLKRQKPKTKQEILQPIYQQMKNAKSHAEDELAERRQRDQCHCGRLYCQC